MSYTTNNDKIYNSWRKMHIRCYDRNYHSYHRYGGRGIFVCEEWQTYNNFKRDLEDTWFEGATLDRVNNDGQYCPENCRWATPADNSKPLKYNIQAMLEMYNKGMRQKDIGAHFGLTQDRVSKLIKRARRGA